MSEKGIDEVYEDRNLAGLGMVTALRVLNQLEQSRVPASTAWDLDLGYRDAEEDGWAIVWATLPNGEVSWHVPEEMVPDWLEEKDGNYDGYDRETKNDRLRAWIHGDTDEQ